MRIGSAGVRIGSAFSSGAESGAGLRKRYVVHEGVRHVVVDVLPWEVPTFRTICGRDIVERPHEPTDVIACAWCRRFERMWAFFKRDLGD